MESSGNSPLTWRKVIQRTPTSLWARTPTTHISYVSTTGPVSCLNVVSDTLDRSLWTPTLSPPLTHGWIGRGDAPSRRILRRIDLKGPPPGTSLSPLHHPDPGTHSRRRNGYLSAFTEIWIPGFEPRPCDEGVVPGEVEQLPQERDGPFGS